MNPSAPRITGDEFLSILAEAFAMAGIRVTPEDLGWGTARLRLHFSTNLLRPGGIVGGPSLFALADVAIYAAVLTRIGFIPHTVTTDLTIHFLRAAPARDVIADAKILRVGAKLAFGEVVMFTDGDDDAICHACGTYAIPGSRGI